MATSGDREAQVHERSAKTARETFARDVVQTIGIDQRVRDEHGERRLRRRAPRRRVPSPWGVRRKPAATARRPAATSATYAWSSVGDTRVKGQRERAPAQFLRDGTEAFTEAVPLAHVRLEMDTGQIARRLDAGCVELTDHPLAVGAERQRDDVDEPRARVPLVVGARQLEAVDVLEQPPVARRRVAPPRQDRVELLQLADADRGPDVVDAVVEPEPCVLEPAAAVRAALVAKACEQPPRLL